MIKTQLFCRLFQQGLVGGYGNALAITNIKEKVVTKGASEFPLDFEDQKWTIEKAVPWMFFGDSQGEPNWSEVTKLAVGYIVGEVDDRRLSDKQSKPYKILLDHLRQLKDISRGSSFAPLVWCRLAVQFWLEKGCRQEKFITAMTRWVKDKNKGGVAYVSYKRNGSSSRQKMPLEAFLFGSSELPDLITTDWAYKHRSGTHIQQPKAKSKLAGNRSDEDQVGSHLLPAVQNAVQELSNDPNGRKLFLHKPDPKTGKFRYKGLRDELYDAIYAISPDISSKRQLKDGRYQKPYSKGSVKKAISKVAICRRSWA